MSVCFNGSPSFPPLRVHGQPKFVTHEALADNILNLGHSTASGYLLPWKAVLTNTDRVLDLVLVRMETDFVNTTPKMRKAWGSKDLEAHYNLYQYF